MTELALKWREMRPDERSFVLSSWIRSFACNSRDAQEYRAMGSEEFARDYAPVVRSLVARSRVAIACLADEPSLMAGWMAVEGDTLHYLLTKPKWRRMGVAKWMVSELDGLPVTFTHQTKRGLRLVRPGWTYRRWRVWPAETEK